MSATAPSLNLTRCAIRQVRWVLDSCPCDRCQRPARRATRWPADECCPGRGAPIPAAWPAAASLAAGSRAGSQFPVEMVVNHVHVWH